MLPSIHCWTYWGKMFLNFNYFGTSYSQKQQINVQLKFGSKQQHGKMNTGIYCEYKRDFFLNLFLSRLLTESMSRGRLRMISLRERLVTLSWSNSKNSNWTQSSTSSTERKAPKSLEGFKSVSSSFFHDINSFTDKKISTEFSSCNTSTLRFLVLVTIM